MAPLSLSLAEFFRCPQKKIHCERIGEFLNNHLTKQNGDLNISFKTSSDNRNVVYNYYVKVHVSLLTMFFDGVLPSLLTI